MATKKKLSRARAYDWIWRTRPDLARFYGGQAEWKSKLGSPQGRAEIIDNWLGMTDEADVIEADKDVIKLARAWGAGAKGHWTPEDALDYIWEHRPDVQADAKKQNLPGVTPEDKRRAVTNWLAQTNEPAVVSARRNPFDVIKTTWPDANVDFTTGGKGKEPGQDEEKEPDELGTNAYQEMIDWYTRRAEAGTAPNRDEWINELVDRSGISAEAAGKMYDRSRSYMGRHGGDIAPKEIWDQWLDQASEKPTLEREKFEEQKKDFWAQLRASLSGPGDYFKYQQMFANQGQPGGEAKPENLQAQGTQLAQMANRTPAFGAVAPVEGLWNRIQRETGGGGAQMAANYGNNTEPNWWQQAQSAVAPAQTSALEPTPANPAPAYYGGQQQQAGYSYQPSTGLDLYDQMGQWYQGFQQNTGRPPTRDQWIDQLALSSNLTRDMAAKVYDQSEAYRQQTGGGRIDKNTWLQWTGQRPSVPPPYQPPPQRREPPLPPQPPVIPPGEADTRRKEPPGGYYPPVTDQGGGDTRQGQQQGQPDWFNQPGSMPASTYYNMNPSMRDMASSYWKDVMNWKPEDMWAQVQRALPRSQANSLVRWR